MKSLFVLLGVLVASPVFAQTTATALWNQSEAPAVANGFVNTLKVDTAAPVPLTATCVAATAPATGSSCSATFPLATPTGSHTYTLLVCSGGFCFSTGTTGAIPGTSGFKISVTVVITTP